MARLFKHISRIENYYSKNIYYDQLLNWKKTRFSNAQLKESFEPIESKWGSVNVLANDIFLNPTDQDKEKFDKLIHQLIKFATSKFLL